MLHNQHHFQPSNFIQFLDGVSSSILQGVGEGVSLRCIGIRWLSLLKHQAKILNTALIECPSLGRGGPGVPPLGARGGQCGRLGEPDPKTLPEALTATSLNPP